MTLSELKNARQLENAHPEIRLKRIIKELEELQEIYPEIDADNLINIYNSLFDYSERGECSIAY